MNCNRSIPTEARGAVRHVGNISLRYITNDADDGLCFVVDRVYILHPVSESFSDGLALRSDDTTYTNSGYVKSTPDSLYSLARIENALHSVKTGQAKVKVSFTSSDGHYTRGDGKIYIFKGTGYCWVESNEAPGAVEKAVEKAVETAVEKEAGVVDKA